MEDEIIRLLSYDSITGNLTWKTAPSPKIHAGKIAGTINSLGYIRVGINGRLYLAHRLAWLLFYGRWPLQQIDHINGIRHDNRIANLRQCSSSENKQNQTVQRRNTSGFIGVYFDTQANKWRAQIRFNRKKHNLGYHDSPESAYEAYLAAKASLHLFNPIPRDNICKL